MSEIIIKSKTRVQKHGEVFTPRKVVNDMLDMPGVKEACEQLTTTFLEPSAGEGAFLVVILERKLNMVAKKYNRDLNQYENYALLALSTLYGIEILEDNAQNCTMNMFQVFYDKYREQAAIHKEEHLNHKVLNSAKVIIAANIAQGDFLTRLTPNQKPIIFNEWKPIDLAKTKKYIKIARTEYTLDEIYNNVQKEFGETVDYSKKYIEVEQLSLFDQFDNTEDSEEIPKKMRYTITKLIEVFKEELEEIDEK